MMGTAKTIGGPKNFHKSWGEGKFFSSNSSVKTMTSKGLGHKEYLYRVLLSYGDGNSKKKSGGPTIFISHGGRGEIFFLKIFGKNKNIKLGA